MTPGRVDNLEQLLSRAAAEWGSDLARPTTAAHRIGDRIPQVLLEPRDAATAAAMLKWADREQLAVVVRGGGTKQAWGAAPSRADVVLSTLGLNAPMDHVAGDLVAVVSAGATLSAVNSVLKRSNQWLPIDPPMAHRATIGGIVSANDSGPHRHRFGTPRDLIIGVEMALVDGRVAKAGGRVVKNVAGYDLSRLLCGSFGSLAVITSATFKLSPVAPASQTLTASVDSVATLGVLALALGAAPLTPSTIELQSPPNRLLVRFETTSRACELQTAAAKAICERHGATTDVLNGEAEAELWRAHEAHTWSAPGTIVKVAILPSDLGAFLSGVGPAALNREVEYQVTGRAALGVIFVRLVGNNPRQAEVVADLRREAVARHGSAVLLSAPAETTARIDPWGPAGDGDPIMRAVNARFDPHNTINPGRGPWERSPQ